MEKRKQRERNNVPRRREGERGGRREERDVEKLAIKDHRSPETTAFLEARQKLRHFHVATMSYGRETLFTQPRAFPYRGPAVRATTELHHPLVSQL